MSVNKYDATHDLLVQIAGSGSEGSFHRTQAVQALAGATSVTISDSRIHATSLVTPFADNGTNEPIAWKTMTLSEGSCVITFDALEADTDFELVVLADSLTEDAYITDLKDVNISSVSNGQVLAYNGTTGKWVNIDLPNSGIFPHLVINTDTNLTVTVTKGTTVITATETSSGVYECDVDEFGTYTISDTQYTENVVIDVVKIYEIFMMPDGETVLPTSDVSTWLECAGIKDKSYTTLQQVLSDSVTFNALLGDSNANKYMARSTTWASTLCADQYAMTMIGQYDVCCDALLGNSTWASAIAGSSYVDSVLDISVPTMTSDTTPSGTVSASAYNLSDYPYKAFDKSISTAWSVANTVTNAWIQYQFTEAQTIEYFKVVYANGRIGQYKIQGSNDGFVSDINDLYTATATSTGSGLATIEHSLPEPASYSYYRLHILTTADGNGVYVNELQFYGRHESQTNIIHSAASDTLYYIDGSNQTIGTTDTSGVGTVDWSNVPVGNLTIYSSVANDTDDLTSAYSKTVRITPHTTEVYVMPDNVLYWYGYQNGIETCNTTNGWTHSYTFDTPTYNTNSIACTTSTTLHLCNVGTSNSISGITKVKAIARSTNGASQKTMISIYGSKNLNVTYLNIQWYANTSDALVELTPSGSTNGYVVCQANDGGADVISALWYE